MTNNSSTLVPTEINLDRHSRVLKVAFYGGVQHELPCEYLRVFSPAAEVKVARANNDWVTGKQDVNIERIEPAGNYAVRLYFSDGHDTGVYSWKTLHELGVNREKNWREYKDIVAVGGGTDAGAAFNVNVIYFATLGEALGLQQETLELSGAACQVVDLLALLRDRGSEWKQVLQEGRVTITVNKQFASLDEDIKPGDEVSITPIYKD